ncbi:MAG: DUF1552 domain-containing protein [Polyangiaceae bacterium]
MTALACAGAWACSSSSGTVASHGDGAGGAAAMGSGGAVSSAISARVRRLSNAEYDATVQALLDSQQAPSARFVPDARLYKFAKFERNEAQVVEPVLARQLQQAAQSLANEYVTTKLPLALPCLRDADAACARSFFEGFLPRAYRRSVSAGELDGLLSLVVTPAIARDGFQSAIALGIEAALQSTAFLYHTELGPEGALGDSVTLTNREVAEALSYLFTAGPADPELTQRLDLDLPERREAEARRLLKTPAAKQQLHRLVKQWLEIDSVAGTSKNKSKFPVYQPDVFDQESNDFVDEVVFQRDGGLALLLGADFTIGRTELAEFYGAPAPSGEKGLIDLAGVPRRGILNLGAFLATFATPEFASPVKRGARFLTQVLCLDPGDPNALNLRVMLPPFDSSKTTRARFEQHSQGACAGCHASNRQRGLRLSAFQRHRGLASERRRRPRATYRLFHAVARRARARRAHARRQRTAFGARQPIRRRAALLRTQPGPLRRRELRARYRTRPARRMAAAVRGRARQRAGNPGRLRQVALLRRTRSRRCAMSPSTARSRRSFLRAIGLGALSYPFLRSLEISAVEAATTPAPQRLICFYFPHGVASPLFRRQASDSEASFALDFIEPRSGAPCVLRAFDDAARYGRSFKNDLVVLDGLDFVSGAVGHDGTRSVFSGAGLGSKGSSIEQYLAIEAGLGQDTPFSSVVLGVGTNKSGDHLDNVSYYKGVAVPKIIDPSQTFDTLFGSLVAQSDPAQSSSAAARRARGQSVIDFLRADVQHLSTRLGPREKAKLDQHLTGLREIEKQLAAFEHVSNCQAPSVPLPFDSVQSLKGGEAHFDAITNLQIDLLAQAMACDLTRFASFWMADLSRGAVLGSDIVDDPLFTPDMPDVHQVVAHAYRAPYDPSDEFPNGDPGVSASWAQSGVQQHYAYQKAVRLLTRLAETGLLESSLVLIATDMGDSGLHVSDNVPFVLAGSAGGKLRTGRYVTLKPNCPPGRRFCDGAQQLVCPVNRLLVSVANLFGANIESFGDTIESRARRGHAR